jgi:hypothetical protein
VRSRPGGRLAHPRRGGRGPAADAAGRQCRAGGHRARHAASAGRWTPGWRQDACTRARAHLCAAGALPGGARRTQRDPASRPRAVHSRGVARARPGRGAGSTRRAVLAEPCSARAVAAGGRPARRRAGTQVRQQARAAPRPRAGDRDLHADRRGAGRAEGPAHPGAGAGSDRLGDRRVGDGRGAGGDGSDRERLRQWRAALARRAVTQPAARRADRHGAPHSAEREGGTRGSAVRCGGPRPPPGTGSSRSP